MKKIQTIILFIFPLLLGNCKEEEEFAICGTRCWNSQPWVVQSFDKGLPCFATENECLTWAAGHGYNGSSCVKCD